MKHGYNFPFLELQEEDTNEYFLIHIVKKKRGLVIPLPHPAETNLWKDIGVNRIFFYIRYSCLFENIHQLFNILYQAYL